MKRRWPDLLIGLLVVLLLLGFAGLLLRPGKRTTATGTTSVPDAAQGTQAAPSGTEQTGTADTGETADTTDTTDTTAPTTGSSDVQVIPANPVAQPDQTADNGSAAAPDTTADTDQAAAPDAAPSTPSVPARTGNAVATSEARTPTRNDYRISLGTFSGEAAAQSGTAVVSGLGYTVYPIAIESGAVAQVGPFADRETAERALADIQRVYPGALLYAPRNAPSSSTTTPSSPAVAAPTPAAVPQRTTTTQDRAPAATTQTTQPTPTPATTMPAPAAASTGTAAPTSASTGPVYLQVAAYNSVEAAQKFVGQVRSLGFDPTVNAPAGQKVAVLVGPFQGDALSSAEAKLKASGLDYFRVR
ncbi:SPOR domain-containing protein [Deinococcus sonorensis]|uniref:SPOR domain-containing protein n=2 Tax=Deinococcus sonorensis TaxID=309891 RepID=A0AAU7UAI7_9DEIO